MKKKFFVIPLVVFIAFFCFGDIVYASNECNQKVEVMYPYNSTLRSHVIYPKVVSTCGGECGGDKDDVILEYTVPNLFLNYGGWVINPYLPDNYRIYSSNEVVRIIITALYGGGLSASGLCGETGKVRVCVGSKLKWVGNKNLTGIYLWYDSYKK